MDTEKGRIYFLMGASGVGKDSVLKALRSKLEGYPVVCLHRYITREESTLDENHISLTEEEFNFRSECGFFTLQWSANGRSYGIGSELNTLLEKGISVFLNGSRAFFKEAEQRYPNQIVPILLTVSDAVLHERLLRRGRESPEDILQRLARGRMQNLQLQQSTKGDIACFDNTTPVGETSERLFQWLREQPGISDQYRSKHSVKKQSVQKQFIQKNVE